MGMARIWITIVRNRHGSNCWFFYRQELLFQATVEKKSMIPWNFRATQMRPECE